jgi:hypothetical protein
MTPLTITFIGFGFLNILASLLIGMVAFLD